MKKWITLIAVLTLFALAVTGCGKKVTCDFCSKEKVCKTKTWLGSEVHICQDCQDYIGSLTD